MDAPGALAELPAHLSAGDRILDVGCGTGRRRHLPGPARGSRWWGLTRRRNMIDQLHAEGASQGLDGQIDAQVTGLFAAWIRYPAGFLRRDHLVVRGSQRRGGSQRLSPPTRRGCSGPVGRMILHLLGRFSLWEWLGLVAHGQWRAARRAGTTAERIFTIGGQTVHHSLYQPDDAYQRFFAPTFWRHRAYSLGCLRPPHNLSPRSAPLVPRSVESSDASPRSTRSSTGADSSCWSCERKDRPDVARARRPSVTAAPTSLADELRGDRAVGTEGGMSSAPVLRQRAGPQRVSSRQQPRPIEVVGEKQERASRRRRRARRPGAAGKAELRTGRWPVEEADEGTTRTNSGSNRGRSPRSGSGTVGRTAGMASLPDERRGRWEKHRVQATIDDIHLARQVDRERVGADRSRRRTSD